MNKLMIISIAMVLIFVPIALAESVSVSRNMPDRVDPNGVLTVSFPISPSETLKGFDIADLIPLNWVISDWSVAGYNKADIAFETKTQNYMGKAYTAYHWKFNKNLTSSVTLTYTISVPVSSGSYDFVGIWTYPGGFNSDKKTLSVAVAPPTCPTCPQPSSWSDCAAGKQTRTNYKCDASTSYACQSYTETKDCKKPTPMWAWIVIIAIIAIVLWLIRLKFLKKPRQTFHYKP